MIAHILFLPFLCMLTRIGRVMINGITSPEKYAADLKRPVKAIALEPGFSKKTSRAFVCGGMGGALVMHEKGWLGHKEQILHSGEGPIYAIQWRGNLIAWANDLVRLRVFLIDVGGKAESELIDLACLGGENLRYKFPTADNLH
jgi:hypothetical protein